MPKTHLGKWSCGLTMGFLLSFGLLALLAATGQEGGETFFSNLTLAIPGILAAICGTLAFLTGILSLARKKERGFLVFLATAIGFFVTVFWIGEIASPD